MRLYEEGLIYRGERIINWCPAGLQLDLGPGGRGRGDARRRSGTSAIRWSRSTASAQTRYITVATTRPETILGDTGVAVNPDDERYRDLVGRYAILPIMNRRIPIVADDGGRPRRSAPARSR